MGVCIHLWEVPAYEKLKNVSREIAGTTVWCTLTGGVCLQKVSVSRGSTVTGNVNALLIVDVYLATPLLS